MLTSIILLLVGLGLVVKGADVLVDGASMVARKAGVSEFVIGLTIVGFGTSCPELVVSLTAAVRDSADVSLGNVVGSNIMNSLLILGLTAILAPIAISPVNRKRDIPVLIGVTLFFLLVVSKGMLNLVDGIIFLLLFVAYMYLCFKTDAPQSAESVADESQSLPKSILMTILGIVSLVIGGRLFEGNAVEIARSLNVSEKFIAVTLLAGGTSLPELVTCVVAALKKRDQLALGNIIGSNIFNILLILGLSAVVRPLSTTALNWVDMATLAASALLIFLCSITGKKESISRTGGVTMLVVWLAYAVYLVATL